MEGYNGLTSCWRGISAALLKSRTMRVHFVQAVLFFSKTFSTDPRYLILAVEQVSEEKEAYPSIFHKKCSFPHYGPLSQQNILRFV